MNRIAGFLVLFVVLAAFWIGLSSRYTLFFLVMGAVAAALVAVLTHDLVADASGLGELPLRTLPLRLGRFVSYLGWLLVQNIAGSIQIASIVLHRRMPLDPALVRIPTELRSPLARTMVANTITLIPGTLTVDLVDDEYLVHAFVPRSADTIASGELQRKVGAIFLEEPSPPAYVIWTRPQEDDT